MVREPGSPGHVLCADGEVVGWSLAAPGQALERTRRLGHPPSGDALVLATMWVRQDHRGTGLGRLLLQTTLRDACNGGWRALEAYGARSPALPGPCVLPEPFLLAGGFTVVQPDARYPLLRVDVRQTVRWQRTVSGALERVAGALVRRRAAPSPARPASVWRA